MLYKKLLILGLHLLKIFGSLLIVGYAEVLGYEEEMSRGIFVLRETDEGYYDIPLYSRFKQVEYKGVPHPLSGDYTPRAQEDIDDSLYVYGKHGPQPQSPSPTVSNASSIVFSICPSNDSDGELGAVSDASSTHYSTCQSNDSDGELGTVTDHSVNDDLIHDQAPIPSIEQVTIATQKTQPQVPKPTQTVDPSCAQHVKSPRQPIRTPVTSSPIPSNNRQNWNQRMNRDLGAGYSFERKPCYVCGSLSHLIKDCDYYEKKMAREAALKSKRVVHADVRQATPAWTNTNRVNKANQFTPRPVQLSNIRPNLSTASKTIKTGSLHVSSGTQFKSGASRFNTGKQHVNSGTQFKSGASRFNTGKQHVNSGSVHVNTGTQFKFAASRVNTGKRYFNSGCDHINTARVNRQVSNKTSPKHSQVNLNSPKKCFSKQRSPVNRPFSRNTAYKSNINAVKGKMSTAVKTSAGCVWKKTTPLSNTNSGHIPDSYGSSLSHMEHRGIFDSGMLWDMTGNRPILKISRTPKVGIVTFGRKELGHFNLFSISQICDKKLNVLFTEKECFVVSSDFKMPDENQVLLKVPRQHNMYTFDMKNVDSSQGYTCLLAKASSNEAKLWHRRLGHLNFKNLNKLVKDNLVRGLPSKSFKNDHTCVACQKGKQHKASCKAKIDRYVTHPLHTLHMDLFGPTSVRSINHASYCLVITDDYSRFCWVFFLAKKDETSDILKTFVRQIENQLNQKVKIIRSDNGTEFKNRVMLEFCGEKGIKQEFSNARTPQQNGVAERMNRTLIEAARTMLADSLLPTTFWGAKQSTLLAISSTGVRVTKASEQNTFDGKSDEGFLVGYSVNSKAFRVYNLVTKRVEVNLHVNFLEEKPNVQGLGHRWMFDLDYLTDSMNYIPVSLQNQANPAGSKEAIDIDVQTEEAEELLVVSSTSRKAAGSEHNATQQSHSSKKPSSTPISKSADDIMVFRKELDALALKHLGQVPTKTPTNTNPVNTGSGNLNTGNEPVSPSHIEAVSPSAHNVEEVFSDDDDDEMPEIRIYDKSSEGIFEQASYDDDGVITDFNNLPDETRKLSQGKSLRLYALVKVKEPLNDGRWVELAEELLQSKLQQMSKCYHSLWRPVALTKDEEAFDARIMCLFRFQCIGGFTLTENPQKVVVQFLGQRIILMAMQEQTIVLLGVEKSDARSTWAWKRKCQVSLANWMQFGQPQPSADPTPSQSIPATSSSHVQIPQPPPTVTHSVQPPPQPSSVQPTAITPPTQPVQTTSPPPVSSIPDIQPTQPPSPQIPSPSFHDTEGPSFEPSYHMSPPPSHEPEIQASISSEESEQLRNLMDIVPRLESRVKSLEKELSETKQTLGTAILQLIEKVKKLENKLKKKRKSKETKDAEDQDQEVPFETDQGDTFVTPEKSKGSGEAQEEQISPSTLEAAQILTIVASEGFKGSQAPLGSKIYKRKSKTTKTPTKILHFEEPDSAQVNTAQVNTAELNPDSTPSAQVNTGEINAAEV
ncbi:putative ribonuclease H-like domain-containing protein [Tanacetum coccineum]